MIAAPNTSQTLNNATISLTLSHPGVVNGSFAVAPTTIYCYTSTDGSVVGLPNPLQAPTLSVNTSSGTLTAGTYYVAISYYGGSTETLISPIASIALGSTGTVIVSAPITQPVNATGYKVYIGTSSSSLFLQATNAAWSNYSQSIALVSVTGVPAGNTSSCSLRFNDELSPSYTWYNVVIQDKNGRQLSGYPQRWYLFGGAQGTISVSSGTPIFNGQVIYPTAIVSSPANNSQQTITGPVSTAGYPIAVGGVSVTGNGNGTIDLFASGAGVVGPAGNVRYTGCSNVACVSENAGAPANLGKTYPATVASRNTALTSTTLVAVTLAGNYKVSIYAYDSAAGSSCSTNTSITWSVSWTDPTGTVQTNTAVEAITTNGGATGGDRMQASIEIATNAGSAITFSTSYTPGTGCSPAPSYAAQLKAYS